MIVTCTGHRPSNLAIGRYEGTLYHPGLTQDLFIVARNELSDLDLGPNDLVILGMAEGWDQACAEAATALQIPFMAALPFDGQDEAWLTESRVRYNRLLESATKIKMVSTGGWSPKAYQRRNCWMVDRAAEAREDGMILALWNRDAVGGTAQTVLYARARGVPVLNCWPRWMKKTS